jgi:hypothetical protein
MLESARQYTDQLLEAVETIISAAMESTNANYNSQINALNQYYETIIANRAELNPPIIENLDGDTDDSEDTSAPADSLNTDMLK